MAQERTLSLIASPEACDYLPGQVSQLRYELIPQLGRDEYMARMREGWRRFGPIVFRPQCPACRRCQSLRIPVAAFSPSQSQRRAWKRNDGVVTIRVGAPTASAEKQRLYSRFHQVQHEEKGWPVNDGTPGLLLDNPFPTEEWSYYVDERLVGVGYVDVLAEGLSAIYFYYDPAERHRSLGTFNVLSILASAAQRGLPHVYLGYYVSGYRSLEYKARFRPCEVLLDGRWQPFLAASPVEADTPPAEH